MNEDSLQKVKIASREISLIDNNKKNKILQSIVDNIIKNKKKIFDENKKDILNAEKKGLSDAFIQRLLINDKVLAEMIDGVKTVLSLNDPIGEILESKKLKSGLKMKKVRVPLGVVLIIYESRPNVTIDVSAICLKSGNACILKGGSDAINSNRILYDCIKNALKENNVNENAVYFIDSKDRGIIDDLLKQNKYIDVVIPRGGKSLIEKVVETSRIPVIKHFEGICNIYVDETADFSKAIPIIINAKVQKPSACNAVENLVVCEKISKEFLPLIKKSLDLNKVEIRGDEKTRKIISCKLATNEDFKTEYLAKIISIKVVKEIDDAIKFVNENSSSHSDAIITENEKNADKFLSMIDSAAVYHNASTRFSDGGCFGMGCEIGISTDKLHARGPMGLNEMTTYKYIVKGNGQIRKWLFIFSFRYIFFYNSINFINFRTILIH